jgi:hypothetical protein
MKTLIVMSKLSIVSIVALYCSGCLSIWSQQASMDETRRERIIASGNNNAIKALDMGVAPAAAIKAVRLGDGAGIGIDVTNWEAIMNHPVRQIGAAIGDAGLIYATSELIDEIDSNNRSSSSSSSSSTTSGGDTININGDGNTVDTSSTTTTPTQ